MCVIQNIVSVMTTASRCLDGDCVPRCMYSQRAVHVCNRCGCDVVSKPAMLFDRMHSLLMNPHSIRSRTGPKTQLLLNKKQQHKTDRLVQNRNVRFLPSQPSQPSPAELGLCPSFAHAWLTTPTSPLGGACQPGATATAATVAKQHRASSVPWSCHNHGIGSCDCSSRAAGASSGAPISRALGRPTQEKVWRGRRWSCGRIRRGRAELGTCDCR